MLFELSHTQREVESSLIQQLQHSTGTLPNQWSLTEKIWKNWFIFYEKKEAIGKFNNGDYDIDDKARAGRPEKIHNLDDKIVQCLHKDKYATSRSISSELEVSQMTIIRHLKDMGKSYLTNKWPHILTEENKANRERICSELLTMHFQVSILHQLITVDEVWLYWDDGNIRITIVHGFEPATSQ